MIVKDVLLQKVQNNYGYKVASSLIYLTEYEIEGERPTRIMIPETDPNTKETNQIGLVMLYQSDITNYIKISKEFKQNSTNHIQLCSSYAINSYKT